MAVVGFIGTGNMGSAIARAAGKSNQVDRLLLANRSPEKAERLAKELGGEVSDNRQVAANADVLFLAVKPQYLLGMFDGIRDVLEARKDRFIIVSMVAGWTLDRLTRELGVFPFVRIMPDIPAQVGAGITLVCPGKGITEEEKALVLDLLDGSGLVSELDEKQLDAANGVTGCGPAFAAMFVEALADGAVACGLPRQRALEYAAMMVKGSAELLLQENMHPAVLKDKVCSPGGSTIQGVRKLEERAFRAAVMDAVIATFEKKF
ncbi:MAG: pyrroline-5-carboxylate reductase [Oscillospiraceae bacterium]|nr:pyrroline-5-carboxylate reductase [Oscillospiraceae bacterium]